MLPGSVGRQLSMTIQKYGWKWEIAIVLQKHMQFNTNMIIVNEVPQYYVGKSTYVLNLFTFYKGKRYFKHGWTFIRPADIYPNTMYLSTISETIFTAAEWRAKIHDVKISVRVSHNAYSTCLWMPRCKKRTRQNCRKRIKNMNLFTHFAYPVRMKINENITKTE